MAWKAATNTARLGPTLGNMMGIDPMTALMLGMAGRPNWGPGSGQHAMMQSQALLPWGTLGSGQSGMSGHQGLIGGNFTGLPFFPNKQGSSEGYSNAETKVNSRYTGPYGAMGNTRDYITAASPNVAYAGNALDYILGGLRNPFLQYPGYAGSGPGVTGSGGGVMGNR